VSERGLLATFLAAGENTDSPTNQPAS